MKLGKLVDHQFKNVVGKLSLQEIPLKTAFKLKGLIKIITTESEKYEEVRKEALNRYGNKKEDGSLETEENGSVKFSQDGMRQFLDEMESLATSEIDVMSIKMDDLGNKVNLTTQELMILDDLVIE